MTWAPHEDDPLFTAELLLGTQRLPERQRKRLVDYLEAVAAHRGLLHVAVAFNAIYFGYDLGYGGYSGGPVDFDLLPETSPGAPAPPVGAMVRLSAGRDPLFGEVVYAEGAGPELGDSGDMPSWLSGAPRGAAQRGATEPLDRLVVDFDSFGAGLTAPRERLARLRRRGRFLDELGHLLLPECTNSFANHLLGPARPCLVTGPLPLLLGAHADELELAAGVRNALHTLDDLLSEAPGLRRWGPYALPRSGFAARLSARAGELNGADLSMIITGLLCPPARRRRLLPAESITYTAIGPRLRAAVTHTEAVTGPAYAVAVCHANLALADVARGESDKNGALPTMGHLRLDDTRQGGGVWRVSHPAGPHALIDPLVPLGLGWLESLPPILEEELPVAEPEEEIDVTLADSQFDWTAPLRLRHQEMGILPLPARVADDLDYEELRLWLRHDGYQLEPDEADQRVRVERCENGVRLADVSWPLDYFPGILLDCWWSLGAPTLNVTSRLLDMPVECDGHFVEHRYDPGSVTRDRAPGASSPTGFGRLGYRERIIRAVRRMGLLRADGTAVLPERLLSTAVFGEQTEDAVLASAVAELLTEGILERSVGTGAEEGGLSFPARAGEPEVSVLLWRPVVRAIGAAKGGQGATAKAKGHDVRTFLRRLRPGHQATEQAKADYREVAEAFGFGPELPFGYTIVRAHRRGDGGVVES